MTVYKGANLTKYDAGGSGDNIIADGYIKSVEKVWLDSFVNTTAITTADTLSIASVPPNKKITGVEVYWDIVAVPTTATIQVGIAGDTSLFIESGSTLKFTSIGGLIGTNGISSNKGNFYLTTGSNNTIVTLAVGVTAMTATMGTIRTIVRYT